MRRLDAALHLGGGAQPLRLLVDARDRGCERAAVAPAKDSRGHAVAGDEEEISRTYEAYREAKRTLQREIKIAKARSWTELVESVESDPWGRIVTNKLRPSPPPLTANMGPMLLD
jgi:hypothetical protein